MDPVGLHQAVFDALNVPAVRDLLSALHINEVEIPVLGLEGGDALLLEGTTDGLLLERSHAPIYSQASPQIFESDSAAYFPFVVFSFPVLESFADFEHSGMNAQVQVDVWHRTRSEKAIKPIAEAVFDALHRQPLPSLVLAGHIETQCQSISFDIEPDGVTRRALLEFRVLTLPN
jgi:hypothetical protein